MPFRGLAPRGNCGILRGGMGSLSLCKTNLVSCIRRRISTETTYERGSVGLPWLQQLSCIDSGEQVTL